MFDQRQATINPRLTPPQHLSISHAHLISDDAGRVTVRIKDYAAGDKKAVTFTGGEFVRRFALHILPLGSLAASAELRRSASSF